MNKRPATAAIPIDLPAETLMADEFLVVDDGAAEDVVGVFPPVGLVELPPAGVDVITTEVPFVLPPLADGATAVLVVKSVAGAVTDVDETDAVVARAVGVVLMPEEAIVAVGEEIVCKRWILGC